MNEYMHVSNEGTQNVNNEAHGLALFCYYLHATYGDHGELHMYVLPFPVRYARKGGSLQGPLYARDLGN